MRRRCAGVYAWRCRGDGPALAEPAGGRVFLAYPEVTVDVDYADRFVDIVGEGFDVAVRVGELADNRLVARKLCEHTRILCAAPAYLHRHGAPQRPADLAGHNCLGFSGLRSFPDWRLNGQGGQQTVRVQGSLISNDNEALLAAARCGVGILAGGDWMMHQDLAEGAWCACCPSGSWTRRRAST